MVANRAGEAVRESLKPRLPESRWPLALLLSALVVLYAPVFAETAHLWQTDEYSAHGAFIPLLSGLLLWWKRKELAAATGSPSVLGFIPLVLGLCLESLAWLTRLNLFATVSLVPVLFGVTLLVFGNRIARILAFPIFFLVFAAPLPRWIVQPISLPIQTISTKAATGIVRALGVDFVEDGFYVRMPKVTVEVAEQCSGFKKSVSLMVFACFYGALFAIPLWRQVLLVALGAPIAILANILRVTVMMLAGAVWGEPGVHRFHDPSEACVLLLCIVLLLFAGKVLGCKKVRYLE
jgi:exosortase